MVTLQQGQEAVSG
ncbi:hypothetical protein BDFB_012424 [Asbolus verrucosus]|uniref:Uncharacterized protein n=1 Tax=Asbolus verrucosus TaxID=1661398 RepID=A0A482VUS8_ASBVE|nr:hypothetical protein BDFB_012424 [Asbolus verrucosus]